jgi:hypothetical protein
MFDSLKIWICLFHSIWLPWGTQRTDTYVATFNTLRWCEWCKKSPWIYNFYPWSRLSSVCESKHPLRPLFLCLLTSLLSLLRPNRSIKSLEQFTIYMQMIDVVLRDETSDMVRYFIMKLFPRPIETIIKTHKCYKVRVNWSLCRCHHSGYEYINAEGSWVEVHKRNHHTSMIKDIKALGWF